MKIQPITIWNEGQELVCDELSTVISFDNLQTEAIFDYSILYSVILGNVDEDGNTSQIQNVYTASSGKITMSGDDYSNWDGSNSYAIQYVASKLNLTIIG